MPLRAAERTRLMIRCERCNNGTEKYVAWLALEHTLACGTCGNAIDLKTTDNRLLIKETDDNCARIDAALAKIGQ